MINKLVSKIQKTNAPIVVGLDPMLNYIPKHIQDKAFAEFGETPAGKWLADNAHKYGFILRYPEGKEDVTGFMYEAWHFRYLGVEKATEVKKTGATLEEYLSIE